MHNIKKLVIVFLASILVLNICVHNKVNAAAINDGNQTVVAYSKMFLGLPYVNGGVTPNGFDCSGFVQYVYAHFGIKLPRTTSEQVKVGVKVNQSDLKPGDIVFFGTANNVYHDGIYIGGGRFIHSPKTGDVVRIEYLKYMQFYAAIRVTNQ